MLPGGWVPLWLNAGISATWGATTEPYTSGYANGDGLFNKFWSGYNFGESAYMATPYLRRHRPNSRSCCRCWRMPNPV